jgi:carbon storage regulator
MLVLSRKTGEKIRIGDNIRVTIVRIGPNNVRVGIEAPPEINIVREELVPTEGAVRVADFARAGQAP